MSLTQTGLSNLLHLGNIPVSFDQIEYSFKINALQSFESDDAYKYSPLADKVKVFDPGTIERFYNGCDFMKAYSTSVNDFQEKDFAHFYVDFMANC